MTNQKRKVSFYLLTLEKHRYIEERNATAISLLDNNEVEMSFQKVYSEMKCLSNGHRAIEVETTNNNYVVEVIEYKDHIAFVRIGQQNYANTAALRDRMTLESEDVPMKDTQLLELYTFCLIDFTTCIISYIGINGAPKLSAVKFLFNNILKDDNISAKLASILTNDIIKTLVNKNIISQITVTVAVPDDSILSEIVGLDENSFDDLRNVKTRTATYKIVAPRNKNIFASSGKLATFFNALKVKHGDSLQSIRVNAKNSKESSQTYDLLEYNFTKTIVLGDRPYYQLSDNDFKDILNETYRTNKDELLVYIK